MMKKFLLGLVLALLVMLAEPVGIAWASDTKIDVAFDGVKMPDYEQLSAEQISLAKSNKSGLAGYYLNARPEMKNDTVFVPVRVISEVLGAKVSWLGEMPDIGQSVVIEYNGELMQLFTSSILGHRGKGMGDWDFTQIPYEKDGSIYVPLRFVAEAFDCQVEWQEEQNLVNILPPARQIDGQALCGVVRHVFSTMENWDLRLDSAFFTDKLYQDLLMKWLLAEVAEPQHLGRWPNLDIPDFYYLLTGYDFMLADDRVAASCEIYVHVPGQPLPEGYTEYLLYTDGKWYNMPERVEEMLAEYHNLTNWQRVE